MTVFSYLATWAATHHLRRICHHFWRMDTVARILMLAVNSRHITTAHNNTSVALVFVLMSMCSDTSQAKFRYCWKDLIMAKDSPHITIQLITTF